MQNRVSLIAAFVVLAVISCLLGTVLMPNSSIGGERASDTEPVSFQEEEKPQAPPKPEGENEPSKEPSKIDTEFDISDTSLVPIETDMHEFMEYVFQPSYKRLSPAMQNAPDDDDKAAWKTIKAEALTLAESANLILMRPPEKSKDLWNIHSVKVRGHGRIMYQAARAKDFKLASQHYRLMLNSCNACHYQFAGGEHILTP